LENRILIVDDQEMIRAILARRLTQEGYACTSTCSGREALSYFHQNTVSLILSDIKMPEMDGMELLKSVKALQPNLMVIIMTAFPDLDIAIEAMRQGAYDFIIKPFNLDLVVLSIKKALEKRRLEEEIEVYHNHLERLVGEKTAELKKANQVLKKSSLDSVKVLTSAVEARDPYTRGHSDRVRRISVRTGMKLGLSDVKLENLEYGALLHDIGKIGIKDEVLRKPGPLSAEEYHHIQQHPMIGVKIMEQVDFFREKIPMVRHHHEHYNGSGYPDGLTGESIPLEARIISIADAFDAMTSERPHRGKLPLADVLLELKKGEGKQFDPHVLKIFVKEKPYDDSPV
jgi:putative two-component system response regulator